MLSGSLNIFGFTFTNDYYGRLDEICDRIVGPQLWFPRGRLGDYPDIGDWSQKTWSELRGGTKRAIIALEQVGRGGRVMGVIIYQQHKTLPNCLELKHLSVDGEKAGRQIGSFLLRQAEVEGTREFPRVEKIVGDVKMKRADVINFMLANRYRIAQARVDLYGLVKGNGGNLDVVFEKEVTRVSRRSETERRIILAGNG